MSITVDIALGVVATLVWTLAGTFKVYNKGKHRGYNYGYDVGKRESEDTIRQLTRRVESLTSRLRTPEPGDTVYVVDYNSEPVVTKLAKVLKVTPYLHVINVEYQFSTDSEILTGQIVHDVIIVPDSCQTC